MTFAGDFIRGDADRNEKVDITDAVYILNVLFRGVDSEKFELCKDASDSNDDGRVDITDAVYILHYLFQSGKEPNFPFPNLGDDPTADELSCEDMPTSVLGKLNSEEGYSYKIKRIDNWYVWELLLNSRYSRVLSCSPDFNGLKGGCLPEDEKININDNILFVDSNYVYSSYGYKCQRDKDYLKCIDENNREKFVKEEAYFDENDRYYKGYIYALPRYTSDMRVCNVELANNPGGCLNNVWESIKFLDIGVITESAHISNDLLVISLYSSNAAFNKKYYLYYCSLKGENQIETCRNSLMKFAELKNAASPTTNGNIIVWHEFINGNPEIIMCDLSKNGQRGGCGLSDEKSRITSSSELQAFPLISDNTIVWEDWIGDKQIISLCKLDLNGQKGGCLEKDEKNSLIFEEDIFSPLIEGNQIFFSKRKGSEAQIYYSSLDS